MANPELYVVTTCMGRLDHLKRTLETLVAQDCKLVVVDYSCPENCGSWVVNNHGSRVHVVRVLDQKYFNVSKAKNAGAKYVKIIGTDIDWIFFLDCDMPVSSSFVDEVKRGINKNNYFMVQYNPGLLGVSVKDWGRAEWFDEGIDGYGYEDIQLILKLDVLGLKISLLPEKLISPIPYGAELQTRYLQEKSKAASMDKNAAYLMKKLGDFADRAHSQGENFRGFA